MPYYHTLQHAEQSHVLFAARVAHWPFIKLIDHVWDDLEHPAQYQLLERELRFIANLHPGILPTTADITLSLRYIRRPDNVLIDCVLVGKACATAADPARAAAETLWESVQSLLPMGYRLQPATTFAALQQWMGWDVADELKAPQHWAEIRRRAEFLLWTDVTQPTRHVPVVYPFTWQPSGWEAIWTTLSRLNQPCIVDISLRPEAVTEQEEMVVAGVANDLHQLAAQATATLAVAATEAASYYQAALPGLRAPFAMRVVVIGPKSMHQAVRGALGGPAGLLTNDDLEASGALAHRRLTSNVEIVAPANDDEATLARQNFAYLEQAVWGPPPCGVPQLLRPLDRLRYLTDAAMALCAFRLPLLPAHGLPGFKIGAEFSPDDDSAAADDAAADDPAA